MSDTPSPAADSVEITRMSLRDGGWVGYSENAVFLDRDDRKVKIRSSDISTIALRVIKWDVAIMSALLVGLGGYVVATRNPLVGLGFAAIGIFSLYRTYTKRYELVIQVENETKPVTMYPAHPEKCHETLADGLGLETVR
jgi:hypothetical protein